MGTMTVMNDAVKMLFLSKDMNGGGVLERSYDNVDLRTVRVRMRLVMIVGSY